MAEIPLRAWGDGLMASSAEHGAGEDFVLPCFASLAVLVVVSALFA